MSFAHELFIGGDKEAFLSFTKLVFLFMVLALIFITIEQLKWNGAFSKDAFQLFASVTTGLLGYVIGKSAASDSAKQLGTAALQSATTALTVPGGVAPVTELNI